MIGGGSAGLVEADLLAALSKSLVAGDALNPIINLSSTRGEKDDFVGKPSSWEPSVPEVPEAFESGQVVDDAPPPTTPGTELVFADAPRTTGASARAGRSKLV